MMKMKMMAMALSLLLGISMLAGCGEEAETPTNAPATSVSSQKEQQEESVVFSASETESTPSQQQGETSSQGTVSTVSKPQKESSVPASSKAPVESSQPTSSQNTSSTYQPTRFEPLSQTKIEEISACVEKDNYEYGENQYFGTYNGYDVLLVSQINGVETEDDTHIKIGGYDFGISGTELLIAYKNYSYIPLTDAYAKGYVSGENMKDIRYWYGKKFRGGFGGTLVCVGIKDPVGDGKKTFTVEDFPEIDIKGIYKQYWYPKWYDDDDPGYAVYLELPIDNQRNVLNVIKILEKMDGVMFAEPDYFYEID